MSFDLVCLESQPVLSTDLIDFFLSSPKSWEAWSEGSCICFYPDLSLVIKHWANWANSISQYKKRTFYLITCNNFAMQDFNTKLYLSVNTQLCYQIIQIQMKSFFLPDWKNIVKKKNYFNPIIHFKVWLPTCGLYLLDHPRPVVLSEGVDEEVRGRPWEHGLGQPRALPPSWHEEDIKILRNIESHRIKEYILFIVNNYNLKKNRNGSSNGK